MQLPKKIKKTIPGNFIAGMENVFSFSWRCKIQHMLYRLCLNTIFSIQRKTNRIEYTDTARYEQHYASTSTTDEAERLCKAIRTLPETERAIISYHLDGYDNKEISELLGISANLVGVKLHRIKQQLATLLKDI